MFSAGDGVFATMGDGTIELVDLKSNSTTVLVKLTDIKDVSITHFLAGVHSTDLSSRARAASSGFLIGRFHQT